VSKAASYSNHAGTWATPEPWWEWICKTLKRGRRQVYDPCPADWHEGDKGCGMIAALSKAPGTPVYYNHPGNRSPRNTDAWWESFCGHLQHEPNIGAIWCAFNVEQFRRLTPSVWSLDGYLLLPSARIPFVWCGESYTPTRGSPRIKGRTVASPGNWSAFWSSRPPARPPIPCRIVPTGKWGVSWSDGPYTADYGEENTS
jgi:hypothetical protein